MANPSRGWVDRLSWVAPALVVGVAALKILTISRFSAQTAFAVVSSGSTASLTFGLVLALIPALLPLAFAAACRTALDGYFFDRANYLPALFAAVVLNGLIFAMVTWWLFVVLMITVLAMTPAVIRGNRRSVATGDHSHVVSLSRDLSWPTVMVVVGVFCALPVVSSARPWLPTERVTFGSEVLVGYVLDEGGEWVTVLTEKERLVERRLASDVTARSLCRVGGSDRPRSIPSLLADSPTYPKC